jgi:hypothetical protein
MSSLWKAARVAVALVVVALVAVPSVASGAPKSTVKPYTLDGDPSSIAVGASADFTLTLTNWSDQQQIGSANISIPELTITSATVATDGSTLFLRNLGLAPNPVSGQAGGSVTVTFTATASCNAGTYPWRAQVKQSNDFNGSPGNDFVVKDGTSLPTTQTTGSCRLAFLDQPADATTFGAAITSEPLSTTGKPVSVRVLDDNGSTATVSGVAITLGIAFNGGGGTLSPSAPVGITNNGVATFPGISISKYGTYRLRASATGFTTTTSTTFNVWQNFCADCTTLSTPVQGKYSSTITSGASGALGASSGGQAGTPQCGPNDDYNRNYNHAPGTTTANAYGNASTDKTATIVIEKSAVQQQPNNGASFYQVCYAAPGVRPPDAALRPGTVALQDPDTNEWVWLLPDCGNSLPAEYACVLSRNKDNAGRVIVGIHLAPGDPTWW